jgi:hypothetical protein
MTKSIVLCAGAVAAVACGSGAKISTLPPDPQLAIGTWGGQNAAAIVTDTVAHVHIGCTFGDVQGRIALDANGRFTLDGTYVLRAYPVYVGPTLPAQFSGQVVGNVLTLAVAVNDTTQKKVVSLGPVSVTLNQDPQMGPCPICKVPGERMRLPR